MRAHLGDRVSLGVDVRMGWELHVCAGGLIAIALGDNRMEASSPMNSVAMARREVATIVVYAIPAMGLMLQGILYLTASQFMPYHSAALGVAWTDLP